MLPLSLVLLAAALRTAEYAHNKAVWLDEAYVALNVLDRDYAGLLKPMEWGQAAPIALLFAERFVVDHVGPSEYALRLVPYLAALAGAVLFWWVLRLWTSARAAPFALVMPLIPSEEASFLKPHRAPAHFPRTPPAFPSSKRVV